MEVPVVRSTPRSMVSSGVLDGESKAQQNSSVISSPLMKKRIEMFASERRNEVSDILFIRNPRSVFVIAIF